MLAKSTAWQGINVTALREIKLLRELRSPNVVQLLDVFAHKRKNLQLVQSTLRPQCASMAGLSSHLQEHIGCCVNQAAVQTCTCGQTGAVHKHRGPELGPRLGGSISMCVTRHRCSSTARRTWSWSSRTAPSSSRRRT